MRREMKRFEDLGCAPSPWTAEVDALGEMLLTCHDTDAARRAHAFLAHSSLMGAAEVRAALEDALSKAGGAQ